MQEQSHQFLWKMGILPTKRVPLRCAIEAEVRHFNNIGLLPFDTGHIAINWGSSLGFRWNREVVHSATHNFMQKSDIDLFQYRDTPIGVLAKICMDKIWRAAQRKLQDTNPERTKEARGTTEELRREAPLKSTRGRRRARQVGARHFLVPSAHFWANISYSYTYVAHV